MNDVFHLLTFLRPAFSFFPKLSSFLNASPKFPNILRVVLGLLDTTPCGRRTPNAVDGATVQINKNATSRGQRDMIQLSMGTLKPAYNASVQSGAE